MTEFNCNLSTVIQELQEAVKATKPKVARVYATIPQTIGGTETYLNFDKVSFDTGNFFEVNNPSRFVCKDPGIYRLSAVVRFKHQSGGVRSIGLIKNRRAETFFLDQDIRQPVDYAQASTTSFVSCIYKLKSSDYIEVIGITLDNNVNIVTYPIEDFSVCFTVEKISE